MSRQIGAETRTWVFIKSIMFSSQLSYLSSTALCFCLLLRFVFYDRVLQWGPGWAGTRDLLWYTSLFYFSFLFLFRSKSSLLYSEEQASHCFCSLPLASYWKSSLTQMLSQLLPGHCWFAVVSASVPPLISNKPSPPPYPGAIISFSFFFLPSFLSFFFNREREEEEEDIIRKGLGEMAQQLKALITMMI